MERFKKLVRQHAAMQNSGRLTFGQWCNIHWSDKTFVIVFRLFTWLLIISLDNNKLANGRKVWGE